MMESWDTVMKDSQGLKGVGRISHEIGSQSQEIKWHGPSIRVCAGA